VSLLFSHFPRGKNTHENAQHQLYRIGLLINNKIEQEIFLYWALITSEVTEEEEEEEGRVTRNEEGACRAMQEMSNFRCHMCEGKLNPITDC
jgi:hypothetical protein